MTAQARTGHQSRGVVTASRPRPVRHDLVGTPPASTLEASSCWEGTPCCDGLSEIASIRWSALHPRPDHGPGRLSGHPLLPRVRPSEPVQVTFGACLGLQPTPGRFNRFGLRAREKARSKRRAGCSKGSSWSGCDLEGRPGGGRGDVDGGVLPHRPLGPRQPTDAEQSSWTSCPG